MNCEIASEKNVDIVPIIADVQNRARMFEIMETYKPYAVYHAAAHKHVPLMEDNPEEAVRNNILGTKNTAEAAKNAEVKKFVMISTDKAVNPPNVMGASKRIAEMIIQSLNDETHRTNFVAVRFGNVLGSRGSVIPLFKSQIEEGGPVTVTHPEMTRYFMTIPEASRLVLQAGALAEGGEVFVLDMGEPVKIVDLARNLIKLSGKKEDDIRITYTGIRPGEKMFEELMNKIIMFDDKILLITGGTGSFGNAVMKQFLDSNIKEIRIFSRDEKKQDDIRKKYNNSKLKFYIGDVRDSQSVETAMRDVDYVFHAAALKQVPSCEFFPVEAVKTNIIGTENVLQSAIHQNVKKVICLSTDKAAYPINAMGISKAMMEKVFVAKSRNIRSEQTLICGTRYGNVMASRGSVIPLFIDKIKAGEPLTITDPDMTRFLMSLEDAVELVVHAFKHAETGDIMVQKAPSSTVGDLATALLELFEADNAIEIIGTRHGEKKAETLLTREEYAQCEDMGDYFRVPADSRDLNYSNYVETGNEKITQSYEYNSDNTHILTVEEIKEKLLTLEYVRNELNDYKASMR